MDRLHNVPNSPVVGTNPNRLRFEQELIKSAPVLLDALQRQFALEAIQRHCSYRAWTLHAAHVRSNHVHVVVWADIPPEKVMVQLKSYASRALNRVDRRPPKRWARHGSTRYLWKIEHLAAAVDYVEHGQGEPMALYVDAERG